MLLSLDVGITTGWALLTEDGNVERSGNFHADDDVAEIIGTIKSGYMIVYAVVEEPLFFPGPLGAQLMQVWGRVTDALHGIKLEIVGPSYWKTHPLVNEPLPSGLSKHQKDAIYLGRVHLRRIALAGKQEGP